MGDIGLTDNQVARLAELEPRFLGTGRPLTGNMLIEYKKLINKRDNPELPATCTSYLKEWYAKQWSGRRSEISSKYTAKGHICEDEAIAVIEDMYAGFGETFDKNEEFFENEWCTGTPDIVAEIIYDAKCPWDDTTFLASVMGKDKPLYIWQKRGYMWLTQRPRARVCYVLLDTPEECNYGEAVEFSHIPIEERFYSFQVLRIQSYEEDIKSRVELCRKWLENYDKEVREELFLTLITD
jgi:hypothetical protein